MGAYLELHLKNERKTKFRQLRVNMRNNLCIHAYTKHRRHFLWECNARENNLCVPARYITSTGTKIIDWPCNLVFVALSNYFGMGDQQK